MYGLMGQIKKWTRFRTWLDCGRNLIKTKTIQTAHIVFRCLFYAIISGLFLPSLLDQSELVLILMDYSDMLRACKANAAKFVGDFLTEILEVVMVCEIIIKGILIITLHCSIFLRFLIFIFHMLYIFLIFIHFPDNNINQHINIFLFTYLYSEFRSRHCF